MPSASQAHSQLYAYFTAYCGKATDLSDYTVRRYIGGLEKISAHLKERGLLAEDGLHAIHDLERLRRIKEMLDADSVFQAFNGKGHRMYSAALSSYMRFAQGEGLAEKAQVLQELDVPILAEELTFVHIEEDRPVRSDILRHHALEAAGYACEMDCRHETFLTESMHMPYMEGHHALPMSLQKRFHYSLDVYANLVCLCPTCHRKIHLAEPGTRRDMAMQLYEARKDRLARSGLAMPKDDFVNLAASLR